MTFDRVVSAAALACVLAACGGGGVAESTGGGGYSGGGARPPPSGSGDSDVELSWQSARVYRPHESHPVTLSELAGVPPAPVAVFLHGCTGLDGPEVVGTSADWGAFLAGQGYIVVMPDSLARPSRHGALTCDPQTHQYSDNPWIHPLRVEEAKYAIDQVQHAPWYDGGPLILGGHSEGAFEVYGTTYAGPTHLIMSGLWCVPPTTHATKQQRVLYVNWSQDPWYYKGQPFDGATCLVPGYDITSITLPGPYHDGPADPVARDAATAFVSR